MYALASLWLAASALVLIIAAVIIRADLPNLPKGE